jgi:S1-C subfamily serine protease
MKHHINALYGSVIILLVLQLVLFVSLSSQTAKIIARQSEFEEAVRGALGELRQENQYKIGEIVRTVSEQNADVSEQIELLKLDKTDFSSVIEDAVKKVVTITTESSTGTGFALEYGNYIVTNNHVISGAQSIRVQTYDGRTFQARAALTNEALDIGLLEISERLPGFLLADSDEITVGEKVIAIGNPLGLSFSVTEGIVSAVKRKGPNGNSTYIQTDVPLNPGNSGGPLINKAGEIIGMNNFKVGGAEALGFALESNTIRNVIEELLAQSVVRA